VSLGLNLSSTPPYVSSDKVTTADTLPKFTIERVIGIVEVSAEGSFNAVGVGGFSVFKGGGLDGLAEKTRRLLAQAAADCGVNAIIGFRYAVAGREVEKSVLAWGTAGFVVPNSA
jgi:uncharacterized protein YbjQ (UPF0145 family)